MGSQAETVGASTWALWRQLPERIAVVAERMSQMEIESLPALTLIGKHNNPNTLLYCDPPYMLKNVHSRRRKAYQYEMSEADHNELLTALEAHPGPVMLSGYDSPLYQQRLSHWRLHTIEARAEANAARTECLWLNPRCVELLGYGPLFDLPAEPQAPAALAARLAAVGCELHHDPQTGRYGYTTEWRLEGWPGGSARFRDLEGVEDWLSRVEKPERVQEVAA